jgi:cell cycle checkpoint control protein RAD9A
MIQPQLLMKTRTKESATALRAPSLFACTASTVRLLMFAAPPFLTQNTGVIKTHRLLLQNNDNNISPKPPGDEEASRLTVSARTMASVLDKIPSARMGGGSGKHDPQLAWIFDQDAVTFKSLEMNGEAKGASPAIGFYHYIANIGSPGRAQISTELSLSADEFDLYDVPTTPITIAFHLREFNVSSSS